MVDSGSPQCSKGINLRKRKNINNYKKVVNRYDTDTDSSPVQCGQRKTIRY
jgi:hypothetical protein